jgi:hypothetical protein
VTYLVIPTNSSFVGKGGMHCAIRWLLGTNIRVPEEEELMTVKH